MNLDKVENNRNPEILYPTELSELPASCLPTREEKERSIAAILSGGMPRPQRLTRASAELLLQLNFREIFFGVEDCLFISTLLAILCYLFPVTGAMAQSSSLYSFLFFISPLFYGSLHLLTVWKETMSGLYEWKMTCRCSLRQLTVLRMLIFGGVSVLATVAANVGLWLWIGRQLPLLRMMGLSFSSLVLFALMQLAWETAILPKLVQLSTGIARVYVPLACLSIPLLWCGLGSVLILNAEKVQPLLQRVPTAAFFLVTAAAASLYLSQLRRYFFNHSEVLPPQSAPATL